MIPMVGLSASADGLEALQKLFGALPVDTGMGFVVVHHLAPDQASDLAAILSRATQMPVCEVGDEPAVEPDHVYVIPPGRDMIVSGGRLAFLPSLRPAAHHRIDRFFRSLADDSAHLAIGVVLSGGGSDGTVGLEEIKAAGGVTFVQDDSAPHESRPRKVEASGCVDFLLPPEKIAEELARIARHSYIGSKADMQDEIPASHGTIAKIVQGATGVDFTHYKASTLRRRITRRMMLHRHETQADYEAHLRANPEEIKELYQDILISVTSFFRDPDAFEVLTHDVFPKLLAACPSDEQVRLWVVGCSSGEEVYSLAMVFMECAEAMGKMVRLQLFATDVNPRCLEQARAGWYPRNSVQDVSPDRLRRFFSEDSGGYRVRRSIRECCVFSRHNLLNDPPFSRVDFISCRNLLIYLEPVLQQKVLPIFHYALKPDGWLWLGSSESVGTTRTLFEPADLRHNIFSRRAHERPLLTRARTQTLGVLAPETASPRQPDHEALQRDAERLLLAKYAPPGVVVSAGLEIVQFQGDTSPFLAPASGAASHHLLKMLREGLAGGVREAVQRAQKESAPVRVEGLRVRSTGGLRALAVEVLPIKPDAAGKSLGFVVLFDTAEKLAPAEPPRPSWLARWGQRLFGSASATAAADRLKEDIRHLTQELVVTRESLLAVSEQHEAVVEELRSANEEAQSANEEMQSVNEELETSKEELEASNKELATLNDELNERNTELNRVNAEVRAARDYAERILENVPRPLLVLDHALRVRTASLAFYDSFQVTPADTVGRFVYDLGNRQWDIPTLRSLLEQVLPQNGEVRDFEVRQNFPGLGLRVMQLNARRLTQVAGDGSLMILFIEDVTERVHADSARRLLAAVVESSDDAIITKSLEGTITSWNRGAEILFGYTSGEVVGGPLSVLAPPERLDEMPAILARVQQGEKVEHFETQRRTKDGRLIDVSITVSPLYDTKGRIVGASKIARDISERKRAQMALQATAEQLRLVADTAPVLIAHCDREHRYKFVNEPYAARFGLRREELLGRHIAEVIGTDAYESIRAHMEKVLAGEAVYFEAAIPYERVGMQFMRYAYAPERNAHGEVVGLVAAILDITDRKRAEAVMQQNEALFSTILEQAPGGVYVVDDQFRMLEVNALARPTFAATEPVIGRDFGEVMRILWGPELGPQLADIFRHTLETGERYISPRFTHERYDLGQQRSYDWETQRLTLPNGKFGVVCYFTDTTEQRAQEEALRCAKEVAELANESKDRFLAVLSHELRTPLTPVLLALNALQHAPGLRPEVREDLAMIKRNVELETRLIDDLLDLSRITSGKVELKSEAVDLNEAVRQVCGICDQQLQDKDVRLETALGADVGSIPADPTRLQQILWNVLKNAVKFTPTQGTVRVRTTRLGPDRCELCVEDSGIGIPPEVLPRIFDAFEQGEAQITRQFGGLGLGLAITRALVERHGGNIRAESAGSGLGATFVIELPGQAPPPVVATPLEEAKKPDPEGQLRVLLVEDHADTARTLGRLLRRAGFDVIPASDITGAIAAVEQEAPDLLVSDLGLPDGTGHELMREVRAKYSVPGIALSGYGMEEDIRRSHESGFTEHLVKPVSVTELIAAIRRVGGNKG